MIKFLRRILQPNRYNGYCDECDWTAIYRSRDDAVFAAFEHMRLTTHATWTEYGRARLLADRSPRLDALLIVH